MRGVVNKSKFIILVLSILLIMPAFALDKESTGINEGFADFMENSSQKSINLKGTWFFHWHRLMNYEDVQNAGNSGALVDFPQPWNSGKGNNHYPSFGYGTYVLKLRLPQEQLAIRLREMLCNYKLYLNETLILSAGQVGTSKEDSMPEFSAQMITVTPDREHNYLILQVSNFHQKAGGAWSSIEIGEPRTVERRKHLEMLKVTLVAAALMTLGLYHLILFMLRKNERGTLFYALFCILLAVRNFVIGERLLHYYLPQIPWHYLVSLEYVTFTLGAVFVMKFIHHSFTDLFHKTAFSIFQYLFLCVAAVNLLAKPVVYTHFVPYLLYVFVAFCFYLLVRVLLKLKESKGELRYLLYGMAIITFAFIHDLTIYINGRVVNELSAFALLAFACLMALFIGRRIAKAYVRAESLAIKNDLINKELMSLNDNLEKEVAKRTMTIEEKNKELKKLAECDGLTGVLNHRAIHDVLSSLIAQGEKDFCVALLDIDHFKQVNDTYGHKKGDTILKSVVDTIQKNFRKSDFVGRYGGEEFLIILRSCSIENAYKWCEAVRNTIAYVEHEGVFVTVSIGIADSRSGLDNMIDAADKRMYRAKQNGRNRTEFQAEDGQIST